MFYNYNPTKILNGIGALDQMHSELGDVDDIVVIHGDSLEGFDGIKARLKKEFRNDRVDFLKIPSGDPTLKGLVDVVSKLSKRKPFLLGVGGGRVLDFTKALAVYLGNDFTGNELFSTDHFSWENTLRLGVIATRPGSGSESNNAFILRDQQGWKTSLFSLYTYPEFCIHDPVFFKTLSSLEYRFGLLDAVIHVLDQYVVERLDSLVVDELSLSYLKMLGQLARTADKPEMSDYQKLAWIGAMVSSGILTRGVDASWRCHELAHALASVTDIEHGLSLALLAGTLFEKNCASPSRYRRALESLALGYGYERTMTIGNFVSVLFGVLSKIEISTDLTSFSAMLEKQCPQYSAEMIEDILRCSIL